MSVVIVLEPEPPAAPIPDKTSCRAIAERVVAMTRLPSSSHVAVIGRRTLPYVLALMEHGCASGCSLRPDVAMPDRGPADLVWIVDVATETELAAALDAAQRRAGDRGRIVVEGRNCLGCLAVERRAHAAGLDVISFDRRSDRLLLATHHPMAIAA